MDADSSKSQLIGLSGLAMDPRQESLNRRSPRMLGRVHREMRFDTNGLVHSEDRLELARRKVRARVDCAFKSNAKALRSSIQ